MNKKDYITNDSKAEMNNLSDDTKTEIVNLLENLICFIQHHKEYIAQPETDYPADRVLISLLDFMGQIQCAHEEMLL